MLWLKLLISLPPIGLAVFVQIGSWLSIVSSFLVFRSIVRPIMEYACVVWDPITQKNITELERVQRKAARFVMGDYKTTSSVRSMLEHLKWPTLEERTKRAKVTMLYRIIHQVVAIPVQPYLIPRGVASTTRGHCQRYQLPYSRLQCHQQSFFPSTHKQRPN
jgi:hypothetical protein